MLIVTRRSVVLSTDSNFVRRRLRDSTEGSHAKAGGCVELRAELGAVVKERAGALGVMENGFSFGIIPEARLFLYNVMMTAEATLALKVEA